MGLLWIKNFSVITVLVAIVNLEGTGAVSYKQLGCYADGDGANHDLNGKDVTYQDLSMPTCSSSCQTSGYPYAGLQNGKECFCGMVYGSIGPSAGGCNYTCGNYYCGGYLSNNVYYTVDSDQTSGRNLLVHTDTKSFDNARSLCVSQNGDLATIDTSPTAAIAKVIAAIPTNASSSITMLWIGLHKRVTPTTSNLEWTNENLAPYVSHSSDYDSLWKTGETMANGCVVLRTATSKIETVSCDVNLPYVCMQLPPTDTPDNPDYQDASTSAPTDVSQQSKLLALYIVLPLFLFCYGGACILYCVHKIIQNCRRRKLEKMDLKKVKVEQHAPPQPRQGERQVMYPPADAYQKKRPPSANKTSIYPAQQAPPLPTKGALPLYVAKPDTLSVKPAERPTTSSGVEIGMTPQVSRPVMSPPPAYNDDKEDRRARLLDNALREARERRQQSAGPTPPPVI